MSQKEGPERRKYLRIEKHFILNYYDILHPEDKYEASQLKNISLGGMCLITGKPFASGARLAIELKTPFLLELTHLEGTVMESHERIKDVIYETRMCFEALSPEATYLLGKLIEHFEKREK